MATRAQKARLGVFLLVAGLAFGGTIVVMVGANLLTQEDTYFIRIDGSVSGIENGAQVRYNGILVGRVDGLEINPDNPSEVVITLSVKGGTPVTKDTVAVLNMQGITGLKYIELTGGDADSEVLEPGSDIPNGGSDFDVLSEKAMGIANKIEKLLDNLVVATSGENTEKLLAVISEAEATLVSVRTLLDDSRKDLGEVMDGVKIVTTDTSTLIKESTTLVTDVRRTLTSVEGSVAKIADWVSPNQLKALLAGVQKTVDEVHARVGPNELGKTIQKTNTLADESIKLVKDADVTLLRTRDDLRRSLDDLATSSENIAEFTQILVDNPSALISGRSESERALP
ncbi:MAG: hypothetical protein COW42_00385 [Deltaproteobacteria bacterium CG17_big_fil_post_rev_8_21_14_2_50_63_7]|nr:MAG: hypothetical protein COW42_00385 [Deltaproteobacteria bacterium CG17_big_fil_post_rev_8_21_14_2_50_63_7]